MYAAIFEPDIMTPPGNYRDEVLDSYLEHGWFRMYDSMFTTEAIEVEDKVLSVHWLRFHIPGIQLGRRQKDIINKNKKFRVTCRALSVTAELETLFAVYKTIKPFIGYSSLETAFRTEGPVFDTWVVEVRNEQAMLIAAGIFDKGKDAIAGIMNFYHPDFEKYSLGKLLLLAKISYCRSHHIQWYYPGYITREPYRFDYKLFPGKQAAQIFLEDLGTWVPYAAWDKGNGDTA